MNRPVYVLKPTKALSRNIIKRAMRALSDYAGELKAGSMNHRTGKWDSGTIHGEYDSLIALIGSLRNLRRSI